MVIDLGGLADFVDLKGATSTSLIDQLFVAVTPGRDEEAPQLQKIVAKRVVRVCRGASSNPVGVALKSLAIILGCETFAFHFLLC